MTEKEFWNKIPKLVDNDEKDLSTPLTAREIAQLRRIIIDDLLELLRYTASNIERGKRKNIYKSLKYMASYICEMQEIIYKTQAEVVEAEINQNNLDETR